MIASILAAAPPVIVADCSPPRSADPALLAPMAAMDPDGYIVAYAPGRAVRPDPAAVAATLAAQTGRRAIPTIATRDMNALAFSNALLGASLLGLSDVVILGGDDFGPRDADRIQAVRQIRPSDGIRIAARLSEGLDFRDAKLHGPVDLVAGGAIDLARGIDSEARLTRRKVEAGARFFLVQPVSDPADLTVFRAAYDALGGPALPTLFVGVDVPIAGGVTFSTQPEWVRDALDEGRPGSDIAIEIAQRLRATGIDHFYLVPPILKGGARDYAAVQPVIAAIRSAIS